MVNKSKLSTVGEVEHHSLPPNLSTSQTPYGGQQSSVLALHTLGKLSSAASYSCSWLSEVEPVVARPIGIFCLLRCFIAHH